jgi:cation:H+ antiporter
LENLAYLIVGLALVAYGTQLALDHAVIIARHYKLSDFFIGVAILAVGSDLPEVVVSVNAAFRNLSGEDTGNLIVGNAIGSCFGQFGLVLGIAGLMAYLTMPRRYVLRHGAVLLSSMVLLFVVGLDGAVSRVEGAALVAAFLIYLVFLFGEEKLLEKVRNRDGSPMFKPWLLLVVGLTLVVASSELIVSSAIRLATLWEVNQSFVAIVFIGIGTSLPELTISIGAILRRRTGMSVGNLVGSNILDVLLPIGLAALIGPLRFDRSLMLFDLGALSVLTLLVLAFFIRKRGLQHREALAVVSFYSVYVLVKLVQA